jgi:hypothetical protein
MSAVAVTPAWPEANQLHLVAALDEVRTCLEAHAAGERRPERMDAVPTASPSMVEGGPPALEAVCAVFGLSRFERAVLLMCAGVELDGAFVSLVARAKGTDGQPHPEPTFSLALAALPEAHWSAITPAGPLRRWRLIEVAPGPMLTTSGLRIDERVLHHLAGVTHVDVRLAGFEGVEPSEIGSVRSYRDAIERIVGAWTNGVSPLPLIQLCGQDARARRAVAAAACESLGLSLLAFPSSSIPSDPAELSAFARLCERESALLGASLLVECDESQAGDPAVERLVNRLAVATGLALILSARERRAPPARQTVAIEVIRPTVEEQGALWRRELGGDVSGETIESVVSQFSLGADGIRDAAISARASHAAHEESALEERVWEACRRQARPRLDDLAQRIDAVARWDDLVLPTPALGSLREIGMHVRHRTTVYERWGFAERSRRGLGISALFAGASGTGKTMAAELLAAELRLDLYRIDLSQVVSKYIGETEKNLRRVFDAADEGGAVLLFDEADALFGKRTEVKDSHDRYANIEVSYLLQRMEAYRGLAILTTNMKEALDTAFLRRIRFVVHFPFPDAPARAEIWRRIFPTATPVDGLDPIRLAQLNLAGGNIRNVALSAAFFAAEARTAVGAEHILQAARAEYAKLDKTLSAAETGGWA